MGIYLPVDPLINANGDLASVVALYPRSVGRARPIDLDAGQRFFASPGFEVSLLSSTTSAALRHSGFVTDATDSDWTVCVVDVISFSESRSPAPRRNIVRATRWGCGLRFLLTISNTKREYDLSARNFDIVSVAAAAGRSLASVSYEVRGIGIGSSSFLALLDGVESTGLLTVEIARRLSRTLLDKDHVYRSMMGLAGEAVEGKPVLSSLPLEVALRDGTGKLGTSRAQSVVFGLRCLGDGIGLSDALERGAIAGYDQRAIRRAYAMICSMRDRCDPSPPTATQMTIAQQWLELKMV